MIINDGWLTFEMMKPQNRSFSHFEEQYVQNPHRKRMGISLLKRLFSLIQSLEIRQ